MGEINGNDRALRKQSPFMAADHKQRFLYGSLPRLTHQNVGLCDLNGLIRNKGMGKWAKSLQELNGCISGAPPEQPLLQTGDLAPADRVLVL